MAHAPLEKALLGALSVAIIGGVAFGFFRSVPTAMEYYKHVNEVTSELPSWRGKQLQLHGFAVPGTIKKRLDREHQRMEYKFTEVNCGKQIDVLYDGAASVPDTFKDGAEVVVRGTVEGDGFHANEIMAKCPSKYQATAGNNSMCSQGKAN
jgi:cytochrome c-type biogenesis protein CcmE